MKNEPAERSFKGKGKAVDNGSDVEIHYAESQPPGTADIQLSTDTNPNASMTPYITAVATFLSAMFSNSSIRSDFSSRGGIEYVLDLAGSPCLTYDFADTSASRALHGVISSLAEQKPHLTIPSLIQRAQAAADVIAPFANYEGSEAFFEPFVNRTAQQSADVELLAKGTSFAKALVNIHSLVSTLNSCFQGSVYNHRSASTGFNQLNLSDYYVCLVQSLGPLLGSSLREEFELNKIIPDHFKSAPRVKDTGFGEAVAELILGSETPSQPTDSFSADLPPIEQTNGDLMAVLGNTSLMTEDNKPKSPTTAEKDSPEFKNFQTIRYLLGKVSRTVAPLFQTLGKSLISKRGVDDYQKWSHTSIADALAETILHQLARCGQEHSVKNFTFCIGIIQVLKDMLVDGKQILCTNYETND